MKLLSRLLPSAVLLLATWCSASGQELVGGWEGGPANGYSFIAPVFSIPGSGPHSFVVRPTASFLYYNYRDSGGMTDVTSPGIGVLLGYRLRTRRLTLTAGPGVEARWDHRRFADGTTLDKPQLGATAQAEAFFQANPLTNLNLIGSYGQANRYTWIRGGLKRQVTNRNFKAPTALLLGPEITAQGNRDARQYQAGAVMELAFLRAHGSVQFRSGYARLEFRDASVKVRPYFGVGLYRSFPARTAP
jgi:hypothetical protein